MSNRPILLTFVRYYLPGDKSGGPVRTIANMVEQLGREFHFKIVATDRDAGDLEPYPDVEANQWTSVGPASVYYMPAHARTLRNFARLIRETPHDILYVNSFFDSLFSLKPLLARRLGLAPRKAAVIAPRGEFSPGAFSLKKWKKLPYIVFSRCLGIHNGLTWQASSDHERNEIQAALGHYASSIVIAPNLPPKQSAGVLADTSWSPRQPGEPLRLCFLSRITPKKNLDFALTVLRDVRVPVVLNVYGGINEPSYGQHCQDIAAELPRHIEVNWHGNVPHEAVPEILAGHDLFFLPTRGENYGHAIHEALSAGLPVLISDQTPWRNLENDGVGWDIPLEKRDRFREVIEEMAAVSPEAQLELRARARNYAQVVSSDRVRVAQNHALFAGLMSSG